MTLDERTEVALMIDAAIYKRFGNASPAPAPAPAPPPQTEAERLVEIARGLPDGVWDGSGYGALPKMGGAWAMLLDLDTGRYTDFADAQFRTIILGVMAAYVGTEPHASVMRRSRDKACEWAIGIGSIVNGGVADDWIAAHLACCLAIAQRRAER
jgi:hypothetical protein